MTWLPLYEIDSCGPSRGWIVATIMERMSIPDLAQFFRGSPDKSIPVEPNILILLRSEPLARPDKPAPYVDVQIFKSGLLQYRYLVPRTAFSL